MIEDGLLETIGTFSNSIFQQRRLRPSTRFIFSNEDLAESDSESDPEMPPLIEGYIVRADEIEEEREMPEDLEIRGILSHQFADNIMIGSESAMDIPAGISVPVYARRGRRASIDE